MKYLLEMIIIYNQVKQIASSQMKFYLLLRLIFLLPAGSP